MSIKGRIAELLLLDDKFKKAGDRSKYMPHQGARECERRRRQAGAK